MASTATSTRGTWVPPHIRRSKTPDSPLVLNRQQTPGQRGGSMALNITALNSAPRVRVREQTRREQGALIERILYCRAGWPSRTDPYRCLLIVSVQTELTSGTPLIALRAGRFMEQTANVAFISGWLNIALWVWVCATNVARFYQQDNGYVST